MGTFLRSYTVDGERFELYGGEGANGRSFQLVDEESLPVGRPFAQLPSKADVVALVRVAREVADDAA